MNRAVAPDARRAATTGAAPRRRRLVMIVRDYPPANTPAAQLPKPRSPVKVTVGGIAADVTFIGNPWLVGITQLNFNLPANTPTGAQPVVVAIGGVASAAQTLTVR